MTLCFRARGEVKENVIPGWLVVEFSFLAREIHNYNIWTLPWIVEPARAVGALELDGSVEGWIAHLEDLGFEDVVRVSCFGFFGPRADRDR
jgi:hypothetical protein